MKREVVVTSATVLAILAVLPLFLGSVNAATAPPSIFGYSYVGKISFSSINNVCSNFYLNGITGGSALACTVYTVVTGGTGGLVCVAVGVGTGVQWLVCWLVSWAVHHGYSSGYIYIYQRAWWWPFGSTIIAIISRS